MSSTRPDRTRRPRLLERPRSLQMSQVCKAGLPDDWFEAASGTARRGWNELEWLRTCLVGPRADSLALITTCPRADLPDRSRPRRKAAPRPRHRRLRTAQPDARPDPPGLGLEIPRIREPTGRQPPQRLHPHERAHPADARAAPATADGGAQAGEDYTATSGTLTFLAGETAKTVTVTARDDDALDPVGRVHQRHTALILPVMHVAWTIGIAGPGQGEKR